MKFSTNDGAGVWYYERILSTSRPSRFQIKSHEKIQLRSKFLFTECPPEKIVNQKEKKFAQVLCLTAVVQHSKMGMENILILKRDNHLT